MRIRATQKLLNISGIKGIKDTSGPLTTLPGEWYASPVSLLRPGKIAVHFPDRPTYISIILPGKSLNKLIPQLPKEVSNLLKRHGYGKIEPSFKLDSAPEVYTTNSRGMLAHMNQIKFGLEYHFACEEAIEGINFEKLNDIHLDYLFGGKHNGAKYIRPTDLRDRYLKEDRK